MTNDNLNGVHATEASRIEEDCLHSARGHFETERRWSKAHYVIGVPTSIAAAVAGVSAFQGQDVWTGIIAVAVAAFAAVQTFLNPIEKSNQHQASGTRYLSLRNQARIFREVEVPQETDVKRLTERLRELADRRDELNEVSPPIPRWAYLKARKGITEGEARYRVDVTE